MRLFIAFPPFKAKSEMLKARDLLKTRTKGRFVRDDQLHLTMLFLGEIQPRIVSSIRESMEAVAITQPPAALRFAGYESFRSTLVLRVDGALDGLERSLKESIRPLGVPIEDRPFKAHITLARDARRPAEWPEVPEKTWIADTLVLYHSVYREKLEYLPLHTVTLRGRPK